MTIFFCCVHLLLFRHSSKMNQDLVGKSVSLDCGTLGFYQGFIKSIQLDQQTLTLEKAFQNGKPCNVPNVTLRWVYTGFFFFFPFIHRR